MYLSHMISNVSHNKTVTDKVSNIGKSHYTRSHFYLFKKDVGFRRTCTVYTHRIKSDAQEIRCVQFVQCHLNIDNHVRVRH